MNKNELISNIGMQIIEENPDPIVKYILSKNILDEDSSSPHLIELENVFNQSMWIKILKKEQWSDGSWGRLHSQDSKARQRIPTTEYGVRRALYLGLEPEHPILHRACNYLLSILKSGNVRDPPEKNERWRTGVNLFSGSTISLIQPTAPEINPVYELWNKVIRRAFETGEYNHKKEKEAHRLFTHISGELRYLSLNSAYHLDLLGSGGHFFEQDLIDSYLSWLWNNDITINYMGINVNSYGELPEKNLWIWLDLMNKLSKFGSWKNYAAPAIEWLWSKQNKLGLWNFDPNNLRKYQLSNSWSKKNIQIDCSTVILCLLKQYYSNT
ncbi:MAG: hypothetical protein ACXABI_15310 [Candidatus Hodarchaeales archaeon]